MNKYEKLWDAIVSQQEKASCQLYYNLLETHMCLYSRESARRYGLTGRTIKFQLDVWKGLEKDYKKVEYPEKVKEYHMLYLRTKRRLARKNLI